MRCHPERQWRGINPPPNLRRPVSEEEYDVASCLLLLANGKPKTEDDDDNNNDEDVDDHNNKEVETDHQSRLFLPSNFHDHDRFECSSCKKVFGSHQALGGHRASHKNVKGCFAIAKIDDNDRDRNDIVLEVSEKKMATELGSGSSGGHKCSVCRRVFSSGQALGGHKRCHWEKFEDDPEAPLSIRALSSINGGLDLNFPATLEEFDYSSSSLTLDLRLGL